MLETYIKENKLDQTLQEVCKILCSYDTDKISSLETTFLNICSYIGSHIDIYTSLRWIDVLKRSQIFIKNDNIEIDQVLILSAMMCILCKEVHISKTLPLNQLRPRVIHTFNTKLSPFEERQYENILPIQTSDSFNVASSILSGLSKLLVEIKGMSHGSREIFALSNKLRLCVEYVSRKNVYIEHNDNRDPDNIWFLWKVMDVLTANPAPIQIANSLFTHDLNAKVRKNRQGLLFGSSFVVILTHKNDCSKGWNEENIKLFKKIKEMAPDMIKKIQKETPKPKHVVSQKQVSNKEIDPIEVMMNFVPTSSTSRP